MVVVDATGLLPFRNPPNRRLRIYRIVQKALALWGWWVFAPDG